MSFRIAVYCLLGGLPFTFAALGAGHFGWWWLSGVVLSAAFVPVARFGPRSPLGQFGAIFPLLWMVGSVCIISEAVIFFPAQRSLGAQNLIGGFVMCLVTAAVLALLSRLLKMNEASGAPVERRPIAGASAMLALSGMAYVGYYLIFGAAVFQFFTRQYYPDAEKIVAHLGVWFWAIELARGVLMALAALPVIYTLRMSRWHAAFAMGALLWVVGGAAPLLVPNDLMVAAQRYMHIGEIFTQNAGLGITAVLLLRPRRTAVMLPQASESRQPVATKV